MKKRGIILLVMMVSTLSLGMVGCSGQRYLPENNEQQNEEDNSSDKRKNQAEEKADKIDSKEKDGDVSGLKRPVDFSFDTEGNDRGQVKGILEAFDENGDSLWTYETEYYGVTELDVVQDIGMSKNGYLILAGGSIYCIDVNSGNPNILWKNDEFAGASASFDFDEKYNLYICGYYGPHLMVIDSDGNTVNRYDILDSEVDWPCSLTYVDNKVLIGFENEDATYSIDPKTGEYSTIYTDGTTVSTTEEFIAALASESKILLEPGVYNLTEWIMVSEESPRSDMPLWDFDKENKPGIYIEQEFDGFQLIIDGIENVYIASRDPNNKAEIVVEPRYATVLNMVNCDSVVISDVILGHTPEEGSCAGDVIGLNNVKEAYITSCDIYGCGAYGLDVNECEYICIDDCIIHDCSYGCMEIYNSNVDINHSLFQDCREFTMFEIYNGKVEFYECTFKNLFENMILVDDDSNALFTNCLFDVNTYKSIIDNSEYGDRINVQDY